MNPVKTWATPARQALTRHKWRWIAVAASINVLSWLALGASIVLEVGAGTRIVLAGIAALATEGTIWLSALLLGMSAYQLRRQMWENLRRRFR